MTRAPWVLPKPSRAYPAGDATAVSTTLGWRLVNSRMPAEWTVSLGEANEQLQERFGISRERQDEFALSSHRRADEAWTAGFYDSLVTPVPGVDLKRDEGVRADASLDKLAGLKPAFRPTGTITAGNASPLSDGASAVLIGSEGAAELVGRAPLARIAGRGVSALTPQDFGFAPVEAANQALARARHRLVGHRRGRAQRSLRGPVAGLHRHLAGRSGDRQRQGRGDRDGTPARAHRGAGSSAPWSDGWRSRASAGAWPRSASGSGRAWPWCWRNGADR